MAYIRTQDKSSLLNVLSAWVEPVARIGVDSLKVKEHAIGAETNHDTGWRLGTFSTKEAALDELDAIERWIATGAEGVYQVSED